MSIRSLEGGPETTLSVLMAIVAQPMIVFLLIFGGAVTLEEAISVGVYWDELPVTLIFGGFCLLFLGISGRATLRVWREDREDANWRRSILKICPLLWIAGALAGGSAASSTIPSQVDARLSLGRALCREVLSASLPYGEHVSPEALDRCAPDGVRCRAEHGDFSAEERRARRDCVRAAINR